jgi:hypothetical protein
METSIQKNPKIELSKSFEPIISSLAEETYLEITKRYKEDFGSNPNEIYWQNACQQFCEILREKLKERGIKSQYVPVDITQLIPRAKQHIYLSIGNYLVDGTWQQFLDQPTERNKFLILNKNRIKQGLREAKVPEMLWFIYQGKSSIESERAA